MGAVLASANRAARQEFDVEQAPDLKPVLEAAREVAREMAVAGGPTAKAALDARAVNVSNGAVALHDQHRVPLRALGIGSLRLLAAGLQAKVVARAPVLLLDEAEHGLEPHRIARLLHRLGSKAPRPAQQVFFTTHSPVVLRELSANQIWVGRRIGSGVLSLEDLSPVEGCQEFLRVFPETFLSPNILICEGKTEVGLLRGLNLYEADTGRPTLALKGVALVEGGGHHMWKRARDFARLGFNVALFRDCHPEEACCSGLGSRQALARDDARQLDGVASNKLS